jgi:hypothetical protein
MSVSILQTAEQLVDGDRNADYGHPAVDLGRTSKIWSAILGSDVSAEQVALCMIGVKISRLCNAYKLDSVIDVAGYARTLQMVHEYQEKQNAEISDAQ